MYSGKIIFAQIMDFLPLYEFHKCVKRYHGNYKVQNFSCLLKFLCMAFAQLTYRESLRDIESCLRSICNKTYHMGMRSRVSRTTLARANENRSWHIYADFAQVLIGTARKLYANDSFGVDLDKTVYALDSSTIDLCLSLFPWARFRKNKGAIKLHTLLDLRGSIPAFIRVTNGLVHDVNILDDLVFSPGAFYILDRGYLDFAKKVFSQRTIEFFRYPHKKEFQLPKNLFSSNRQIAWSHLRSNNLLNWFLFEKTLSGKTSLYSLFRFRNQKTSHISNEQFRSSCNYHNTTLQMPLANRTVFQMGKAAFANKSVLLKHPKTRQKPKFG